MAACRRRRPARAAWFALLAAALLPSCTSLLRERAWQSVAWDDGDAARVEVWLRQVGDGSGQPWRFALDVAATPLVAIAETVFAIRAWRSDKLAIAGGPLGYLASLLPGITCAPLNQRGKGLRLLDGLHLPASERAALAACDGRAGVAWLAACCERYDHDAARAAAVRTWVCDVRLVPGEAATGAEVLP